MWEIFQGSWYRFFHLHKLVLQAKQFTCRISLLWWCDIICTHSVFLCLMWHHGMVSPFLIVDSCASDVCVFWKLQFTMVDAYLWCFWWMISNHFLWLWEDSFWWEERISIQKSNNFGGVFLVWRMKFICCCDRGSWGELVVCYSLQGVLIIIQYMDIYHTWWFATDMKSWSSHI